VIVTAIACFVAAWLAHFIAASLNLQRPFALGLSPMYIPHSTRGSFPSAHATVMFTAALLIMLRPPLRGAGAVLTFIAACMGWARIYAGIHFPMDIAAGLLFASMLSLAVHALWVLYRAEPPSVRRPRGNGPSQQRV
jgi:undecaprenyl-diphosphatase